MIPGPFRTREGSAGPRAAGRAARGRGRGRSDSAGPQGRSGAASHAGRPTSAPLQGEGGCSAGPGARETLRARDERVFSYPKPSTAEYLRHASRKSGRRPLALVSEHLKLLRGPGRMTLPEYVQYGIYDPEMDDAERRRFITNTLHWPITHQCCDMTWSATTEDTWLCARLLEGSGIPMPRTLAIIDRSARSYPGTRTIGTPAELRDFALAHVGSGAHVFGKENRGISGFGTFLVREADNDRLHLEGEGWYSYEDCLAGLVGDTVYILQPVERNHAFFSRYTDRLATVRVCLLLTRSGPKIPFTVLKVPGKGNTSDHAWRKGNLACDVDPRTGVILRASTKDPFGTTEHTGHPDTGARLLGETVPRWDEVLDLARYCSQVFAPVRYQSMDVAITPDGPKLIEINTGGGFDLPQLASGRGFLTDEVRAFFRECGVKLRGD